MSGVGVAEPSAQPVAPASARFAAPVPEPAAPPRRVLIIAAGFPPTGGPGVQRTLKFAKYLPEFGWRPYVWTADRLPGLPRDESLLRDVADDLPVHRRPARDPRDILRGSSATTRPCSPDPGSSGWRAAFAWRMEKLLTAFGRRIPLDPFIGWALEGYRPCRELIETEDIDAIYSTFSPPSNHLLGWMLRRATGLPWVADFRDLWTADYNYPHTGLRRRVDRWFEQSFLEAADAVIGVTPSQTDLLAAGAQDPSRFFTVTNGLDDDDFASADPESLRRRLHGPTERFVLAFTGWFLSDRVHPELIDGLVRFARLRGDAFELRIVGALGARMQARLEDAGVPVRTTGYLPHDQAIEHMIAADALLLPIPPGPNGHTLLPGKTFEYLAAGPPILAVGPPQVSEVARLLRTYDAGVCVPPDAAAIHRALHKISAEGPATAAPYLRDLRALTRRNLTSQLARILQGALRVPGAQQASLPTSA